MPNDDERVDPNLNSDYKSQSDSSHSYVPGGDVDTADFLSNNSRNDVDSSDDIFAGFGQMEGNDYEETFSPVFKMVTVRCLLNIVVFNSWFVFQLDVNNAFLYDDLVETVYMKPPEGYFPSDNKVCRLKKSLYDLKQAHRQKNAELTSTLIENGFSQSKSDYSLYTKSDKEVFLALLVYVDDIIITARPLALPGPEQNTDLQLGVPGFSTPYAFNPSPKKPRSSPVKHRHNFDLMFKHHEM
nr:ribonuclease H-like domain-containing protein [Tanacetum cinerariifolium]